MKIADYFETLDSKRVSCILCPHNCIIENGKSGYLIENRDSNEMVSKIDLLITDEKLRKKIGKEARCRAKDFSGEVVLEKWSKLINKRK